MSPEQVTNPLVESILQKNLADFARWRGQVSLAPTLDIPEGIARVFIPQRILELAKEPNKIDALVVNSHHYGIDFIIYERREAPITNSLKLNEWLNSDASAVLMMGRPESQDGIPEDIDYKHLWYESLLERGELTLNDKVYIQCQTSVQSRYPNIVRIDNYLDRQELQRIGIGGSFFDRFEYVMKLLGFSYIIGEVVSQHRSFFEKRWIDLSMVSGQERPNLPSYLGRTDGRVMIKAL